MQQRLVIVLCSALAISPGCTRLTPEQKAARFTERGKDLLAKKDYSRALLEFRNASSIRKKDADLYYQSALAFLGMGDLRNAVVQLQAAIQVNPNHVDAQRKYAELLAESGRPELAQQAADRLESVLAQAPQTPDVLPMLAFAEIESGKQENAIKHLNQALERVPEDFKATAVLASFKLAHKDAAGGEAVLREAIAHAPQSVELGTVRGRFYWVEGRTDQAKSEFRRVLTLRPQYPAALFDLATLELATGNPTAADQLYRQLSSLPQKEFRSLHAMFLMRQKQYKAAASELQGLWKTNPEDRALRNLLTTALVYDNRAPEASRILDESLKKNPNDIDALLQRSELYQKSGNLDKAEQDLTQVVYFNANWPAAHLGLARVYRAKNQGLLERQELDKAVRLDPSLVPARTRLAEILTSDKDPKAALELVNQAPTGERRNIQLITEKNRALLAMKDYTEARKSITAGMQLGGSEDILLQDAVLRFAQEDYDGGRASLEKVLEKDPSNLKAMELFYNSYRAQKRVPDGLAKVHAYVNKNPDSIGLHYFFAKQLSDAGRRNEARQQLEALKQVNPKFTLAEITLAQMDVVDKNLSAARSRLSSVLSSDPKNVAALFLLGNIEDASGNPDAGAEQYAKILSIDGSNLLALNNLAFHLSDKPEKRDEAVKLAERANQLSPDNPDVQDTLGWVYFKSGEYERAVKILETAAAAGDIAERKFHLAMAYMKTGHREQGRQLLLRISQKDPAFLKTTAALIEMGDTAAR